MKRKVAFLTLTTLAFSAFALAQAVPLANAANPTETKIQRTTADMPWLNPKLEAKERARLLVEAMTPQQKVHMLHGASDLLGIRRDNAGDPPSIGYIPAIPELRVPALVMTDGPAGLRNGEKATVMPAPIAQASSFDPQVAESYGRLLGRELSARGQDLLFGPGFNLARNPQAGRAFEYLGEDPLLAGTLAAANVKGVQSEGVMATLKHYVANNQETNRTLNSSNMDSRTLREIYVRPFEIAIKQSQPAAVMCAYNRVNNVPACGNRETMTEDLRGRMGFRGFTVTDYPAAWSATDIAAGLNVELPWGFWTSQSRIERAITDGKMTWGDIDARITETLTQMFRFGLFDHPWDEARGDRERPRHAIDAQAGYDAALNVALRGPVLLKNDGTLPLTNPGRVLVVGSAAKNALSGGGSSGGKALLHDSALDELRRALPGSTIEWKSEWNPLGIRHAARNADVVVVFAGVLSTELLDRPNLKFMPHINNAVHMAASANPNTVVVTQTGGPVLMPWLADVRAVLNVWYPGEAGGLATAKLLTGQESPSGRLPQTFPATGSQFPANERRQFPGAKGGFQSHYDEGVFMGYRWYSTKGEKPLFPFGFGLTYTTFEYSGAQVIPAEDGFEVTVTVTNTGQRVGRVVPQVYVQKPGDDMPARELVAFQSVQLQPGQSQQVRLHTGSDQLAYFDAAQHRFTVRDGEYKVFVGDNVEAAQLSGTFTR